LITHRYQISPWTPTLRASRERCCEQDHHRWPLGWLVAASRNCIALSCVAVGVDLLSLPGAADLVALAWPVSGILAGRPIVAAGTAARSAASRLAVCIAIAIHGGYMR
jgi:hypothetical protein